MSSISPVDPTIVPILPPQAVDTTVYVSGFTLSLTVFILGSIFMLLMIGFIFMMVFGQPMSVARKTASQGSVIQHFNTSKSAIMKDANIAGGAFRYQNVRDGTVAATTGSVNNMRGRNVVLTFAQLGVTIPIPILGGISVLVHQGINNIKDLKTKMSTKRTEIYTQKIINPETLIEETVETERKEIVEIKNIEIVSGYDFENFDNLIKQSTEEKLIPLVVEAVPDFVERNINADYTEKKIKIRQMMNIKDLPDSEHLKIMTIAIAVAIILVIGMFVK